MMEQSIRKTSGGTLWHVTANEVSPRARKAYGSATVSAPRPTCSRVTTADGRSPGSRLTASVAFPGHDSQWQHNDRNIAAYSCGGRHGFGSSRFSPRSLLIPEGNRHGDQGG